MSAVLNFPSVCEASIFSNGGVDSPLVVDSCLYLAKNCLKYNQLYSAMLDLVEIYIPFKDQFFDLHFLDDQDTQFTAKLNIHPTVFSDMGLKVFGWGIFKTAEGVIDADAYCVSYDSLPTSFTGIAWKLHLETNNIVPYVVIKCSPAKILQGHNVYGSISLKLGALEMLTHFQLAYPDLEPMLNFKDARVSQLDITASAVMPNADALDEAIKILKNTSSGQTKARFNAYQNTANWCAANSKHKRNKAYGKEKEFFEQLKDLTKKARRGDKNAARCVEVMSDPKLQEFVKNRLRFEASILKHFFEKQNVSDNLWELIHFQESNFLREKCVFTEWWKTAFADIFNALEGQTMQLNDDDAIYDKLCQFHQSVTRGGNISFTKADRLLGFYRAIRDDGYEKVKQRYGKKFYKSLDDLLVVKFCSKSDLQNLKSFSDDPDRIHSVLNVINVDFANQRPIWYEEPTSFFQKAA